MSDTQCAQQSQLVVLAHDLKHLATPIGGSLRGHFTARVPARDAHICFFAAGSAINNSSEWVRPPQYRWTTPKGEERYAPVVTFGSMHIERACVVAALRAVLAKRGPAP
jgi:hypothetical protein